MKTTKKNQVTSQAKFSDSLIEKIHSLLPKKSYINPFATHYISSMSTRSLLDFTPEKWVEFISDRYDYFIEHGPKKETKFRLHQSKTGQHIFEYVCPDAPYLLRTFEHLFHEQDLRITRMFHPIMHALWDTDGALTQLENTGPRAGLMSITYIEFEEGEKTIDFVDLKKQLTYHMTAIHESANDNDAILATLNNLQRQIATYDTKLSEPKSEWFNLFDWLKSENFSFFGYVPFTCNTNSKAQDISCHLDKGYGILSKAFTSKHPDVLSVLTDHNWRMRHSDSDYVFDRVMFISPVQRFVELMRLSLRIPGSTKGTYTEHIFVGILRQSSLFAKNMETPLIHLKMKHIFATRNMLHGSYDYNEVIRIFTTVPKYDLFRRSADTLLTMVDDLLSITNPNDVYCFTQRVDDHTLSLMVVLPLNLFNRTAIDKVQVIVKSKFKNCTHEVTELSSDEHPRLQFYFECEDPSSLDVNSDEIEDEIREKIQTWEYRFKEVVKSAYPLEEAKTLSAKYLLGFPEHYRIRRTPEEALYDMKQLESIHTGGTPIAFNLSPFVFEGSLISGKASLLNIYNPTKIELIDVMPILENLGFHVYDELTARIGTNSEVFGYMHNFRFVAQGTQTKIDEALVGPTLIELLTQIFLKRTTNDRLNGLALLANLNWRSINMLQCYRNLLTQISGFSKDRISSTLLNYPACASLLVTYFHTKFSTDSKFKTIDHRLSKLLPAIKQSFLDALQQVDEVSDDLILRRLINLIDSTIRTNYFLSEAHNRTRLSIKLDSSKVNQMPLPVPYRDIYMLDVEVEGCHLRFGPASRGGLRWSNRDDDFRTEVLGLVKTQQTKNVVIVPVGSKGGFIVKNLPKDKNEAFLKGQVQYKEFIRSLLDITDTLSPDGALVHPQHVVHYDGPDPYLVVAADKGTASFSDFANDVSAEYGFWLGDAFASGGSVGYNHKEVGITARGGWECVKLHFKERFQKDIQTTPFSVVGVGDMSGDVFGNGMLLSRHIVLNAAFNHMHIFLDPTPNTEVSFKERERLFALPTSSWEDYNPKLISQGGGLFSRKAKAISLSPECCAMLGVSEGTVVTGEELITLVLKMDAELLWLGGIGTYIKADTETHISVGDPANDAVRINASECRMKVIGEGANLGLTQDARIQLDASGHFLNSDAIDNSAGVNMSDYEVNIKILLDRLLKQGIITSQSNRNSLLASMTEEVAELCLRNNRDQHALLSADEIRSNIQFNRSLRLIDHLEDIGLLNPKGEGIPDHPGMRELFEKRRQIPRSILAKLQAYAKMWVFNELIASDIQVDGFLQDYYVGYFTKTLQKKYPSELLTHHLKREILCTVLSNRLVNQAGSTFFNHLYQLTGRPIKEIALAYVILDLAIGGTAIRDAIRKESASLDHQYEALVAFDTMLASACRDLLSLHHLDLNADLIQELRDIFDALKKSSAGSEQFTHSLDTWISKGFSKSMAHMLASLPVLSVAVDIYHLKADCSIVPSVSLKLIPLLNRVLELDTLETRLDSLKIDSHWEMSQRDILQQHLRFQRLYAIEKLVAQLDTSKKLTEDVVSNALHAIYSGQLTIYFDTLKQISKRGTTVSDFTSLTVVINRLKL